MSVNKKNSDGSYNQYASKPYVTKDNIGLSRVENKNSEDIRGEITSKNVTDALGYTPVSEEDLDKTSIPMIEVVDGKSLATEEGFAKIVDWDKNIGEYDITVCGVNLFDGTVKHGVYLHSETGLEFNGTANTSCTGFIPLMSNNAFIDTSSVYNFIYRYDKDQNFISPRQPISTRTFDDNVKYIRLASVESANFDDLIVSNSESPYEAYKSETFHITNDTLPFTIPTYSPVTNILAPSYVKTFIGENEQGKYFVDMVDKADATELNYLKDTIKGAADGQFIYDIDEKMTKVVPDGVNKGVVAMIGGSSRKTKNLIDISNLSPSALNGSGQTITPSKDGLTFTGTSTATGYTEWQNVVTLPAGSYKFSIAGDVKATVEDEFKFRLKSGTTNITEVTSSQFAEGIQFSVQNTTTLNLAVFTSKVTTITGTAKPMIRLANENSTYEPYGQLWNAPVTNVIILSPDKVVNKSTINDSMVIVNNDPKRSRTDIKKYESDVINFIVSSKSGKTVLGSVNLFNSDQKRLGNSGWISSGSSYTIAYSDVAYVALLMKYSDDSNIIDDDIILNWNMANKTVISIPSEILNLPDYGLSAGDTYNYIDFENMVYHHRVGNIDLGSITWSSDTSGEYKKRFSTNNILPNVKIISSGKPNLVSSAFNNVVNIGETSSLVGMSITASGFFITSETEPYANMTNGEFKSAMSGQILNYEIEEELIDISDILMPFMLESGGTITFENEHNLDVPNTVIYEKEMI